MLIAKKFAKVFEIAEFLIRITITYSSLVVKYQVQNSRARMPGNSGHLAKSCFPNRKNQDFFFKCPLFAHAQQKYMPSTMPITDCQVIPSKNAECQVMPSFMPSKIICVRMPRNRGQWAKSWFFQSEVNCFLFFVKPRIFHKN